MDTIIQPNWQRCPTCGKHGPHGHNVPRSTTINHCTTHGGVKCACEPIVTCPQGRDTLDAVLDEVTERRAMAREWTSAKVGEMGDPNGHRYIKHLEPLPACPRCKHVLADMRPGQETCSYFDNAGCTCACWNVLSGSGPLDVRDGG